MSDSASHPFAAELRAAVSRRGLPLNRIQARLAALGHPVAQSTISQWQRGHRLPRTERSLATVTALEAVLEVPSGRLRDLALLTDARPVNHLTPGQRGIVDYGDAVEQLLDDLGATSFGSLQTLSAHDRLVVGDRGCVKRRRTTLVLRAASPADRYVVTHAVDDGGDVALVTVRARRGCRVGRVARAPEAGVMAVELHLDRTLAVGETAVLETQILDDNDVPGDGYYRWTTRESPLLVIEATFDREHVPGTVHEFARATLDGPDLHVRELALTGGEHVHLVRQPTTAGVHGLRWAWPS